MNTQHSKDFCKSTWNQNRKTQWKKNKFSIACTNLNRYEIYCKYLTSHYFRKLLTIVTTKELFYCLLHTCCGCVCFCRWNFVKWFRFRFFSFEYFFQMSFTYIFLYCFCAGCVSFHHPFLFRLSWYCIFFYHNLSIDASLCTCVQCLSVCEWMPHLFFFSLLHGCQTQPIERVFNRWVMFAYEPIRFIYFKTVSSSFVLPTVTLTVLQEYDRRRVHECAPPLFSTNEPSDRETERMSITINIDRMDWIFIYWKTKISWKNKSNVLDR